MAKSINDFMTEEEDANKSPLALFVEKTDSPEDVGTTLQAAQDKNPDQYAESMSYGKTYDIPTNIVDADIEPVRKMDRSKKSEQTLTKNKSLAAFLSNNMDHAIVAQDDIDPIDQYTKLYGAGREFQDPTWGEAIGGSIASGSLSIPGGIGAAYVGINETIQQMRTDLNEISPLLGDQVMGSITGLAGLFYDEVAAPLGQDTSEYFGEKSAEFAPRFQGTFTENPSFKRGSAAVAQAVPSIVAAMLASMAAGPQAGAFLLSASEAGPMFEEAKEAGEGTYKAAGLSAGYGAASFFLEKYGLEGILKAPGGAGFKNALKNFFKGGLPEAGTELLQTITGNTIAQLGYDEDRDLLEGGIEAVIGGLFAGGGMASTSTYIKEKYAANKAEANQEFVEKLAAGGDIDSKTLKRSPELFQSVLQAVVEKDGGLTELRIPMKDLNAYFEQVGMDKLQEILEASPELKKQYDEAVQIAADTGVEIEADLIIPTGVFAARFAPDHGPALARDIRIGAGGMTFNESQQWKKDNPELIEKVRAEMEQDQAAVEANRTVYDEAVEAFTAMNIASGRYARESESRYNAIAMAKGMVGMAVRAGKDPAEVWKQYNPQVRAMSDEEFLARQEGRVDEDGITYDQEGNVIENEAFKAWSENGEVVESDNINDFDFEEGKPVVLKLAHGTTHDFTEFEGEARGNKGGFLGALNYFTSSEEDASGNYHAEGADLTSRIEQRADQIENEIDQLSEEEIQELADEHGLQFDPETETYPADLPSAIARAELAGDVETTLEVFVKVKNPLIIGDRKILELGNYDEVRALAVAQVAEENEVTVEEIEENWENYEDEVDEAHWQLEEENPSPLYVAIEAVALEFDLDPQGIFSEVGDYLQDGMTAEGIKGLLEQVDEIQYASDQDTGENIGPHVVAQIFKEMGYDAIILKNADKTFPNMDMPPGTTHVHVFDKDNTNIKSVQNRGTFDPADPNIFNQQEIEQELTEPAEMEYEKREGKTEPKKTVKAYKLFRIDKKHPGKLFPLFVDAKTPVPMDEWIDATDGGYKFFLPNGRPYVPATTGNSIKVQELDKQTIQDLFDKGFISSLEQKSMKAVAYRPGWHAGDSPMSTHLGFDPQVVDGKRVVTKRGMAAKGQDQVWVEVEMPADTDWQTEADKRGTAAKDKAITDQIPVGGFYRYKTNPNMTGNWLIAGSVKINKILTDEEVAAINEEMGVQDLPRQQPLDLEAFGFVNRVVAALNQTDGVGVTEDVVAPPAPTTFFQVHPESQAKWKEETKVWMEKNDYSPEDIERQIAGMEGQMKIFEALGPVELEMFPHGKNLVKQKVGKKGVGGPFRTNDDPIYKITFDASAMCVKRLEAAETAAMIQAQLNRALTTSERMALAALFQMSGKQAPCIYCYVEAPRAKMAEFAQDGIDMALGIIPPKASWAVAMRKLASEAAVEVKDLGLTEDDLDINLFIDPDYLNNNLDQAKELHDKAPITYNFISKAALAAKANLPKLYEEYSGQIMQMDQGLIDELNGYAGLRFFSSSDFQVEHVADLMQAFVDMSLRKAKSHSYTKVPMFADIFGPTGMKINTSIFAKKDKDGNIVEDSWQGMEWGEAQRLRGQYDNVGSILVATSDEILQWGLDQDWIDFVIPFHYSGLEKKFYGSLNWEDFTSTQSEKSIDPDKKPKKIRMHEITGGKGMTDEQANRAYLELAMKRKLYPVFPAFIFKDGQEPVYNKKGDKLLSEQRRKINTRERARWAAMVESGKIDWSMINPAYFKLKKDYARTDTDFNPVQAEFNQEELGKALESFLSGAEPKAQVDDVIMARFMELQKEFEESGKDIGIETLVAAEEGRTFFQSFKQPSERMSVAKTQEEGMLLNATVTEGSLKVSGLGSTHYETHAVVPASVPAGVTNATGFVTPDGKFLDRMEALAWLKANRRDVYKALDAHTRKTGLESQDYANAEVSDETDSIANQFMMKHFGHTLNQSVYHGTAHTFDKFSLEAIGTGEGAQAYGWGLYFAGKKSIAEFYRDKLSGGATVKTPFGEFDSDWTPPRYQIAEMMFVRGWTPEQLAAGILMGHGGDLERAQDFATNIVNFMGMVDEGAAAVTFKEPEAIKAAAELVVGLKESDIKYRKKEGQLIQAEIPEDDVMLLWDKPLSEQSETVKKALGGGKGSSVLSGFSSSLKSRLVDEINEDLEELGYSEFYDDYSIEDADGGGYLVKNNNVSIGVIEDVDDLFTMVDSTGQAVYHDLESEMGAKEASEYLNSLGIKGIKYADATSRSEGSDKTYNYVVFDDSVVTIEAVNDEMRQAEEMFQGTDQRPAAGQVAPRASIELGQEGITPINLYDGMNLTSLLHETGHFYLQMLSDFASEPDANEDITKDWEVIKSWLGVGPDGQITRAQHELFADGFLNYLMENEAPSPELRTAFARFRQWLSTLKDSFQTIVLSKEVKDVFSRILATDEEITRAEQQAGYDQMFKSAEEAGMTATEWADYTGRVAKARLQAEEILKKELMAEMKREQTSIWKAAKAKIKDEVEALVNAMPVYNVGSVLRRNKYADGTEVEEDMKDLRLDGGSMTDEQKKKLVGIWVKTGGTDIDELADMFGFASGDEMMNAMIDARPKKDIIDKQVAERMAAEFGDLMMDDQARAEEADKAIHSDKRGDLLNTEIRKLGNLAKRKPSAVQAVKAAAQRIISSKKVRDLRPDHYQREESKAARAALKAAAKGDWETAFTEKQKQIMNHHLYREARQAKDLADKSAKRMVKLGKDAGQKRIAKAGGDFLEQVNHILERFEFKPVSLKALDKRQTLLEFVTKMEEQDEDIFIDEKLINEAYAVNYKDLTVSEMQGIVDTVDHLLHLVKTKNRLLDNKDKRDIEEIAVDLAAQVKASQGLGKGEPVDPNTLTTFQTLSKWGKAIDASLIRMEQIVDWLDGGDPDGPWAKFLWNAFPNAQNKENDMMDETMKGVAESFKEYGSKKEMDKRFTIRSLGGESVTKTWIMSVALNVGNDSNYNKLMHGYGWNEDQLSEILSHMTEKDWQFVQSMWNQIDELWPKIIALEKEVRGLPPEKIEPRPVMTKFGTFAGGYYPVVYDKTKSQAGKKQQGAENQALFDGATQRATTPRGHLNSRIESFAAPIKLGDLSVIPNHLSAVIHDLSHRTAIRNAEKIMSQQIVRDSITETLGHEYVEMIDLWIQSVANDRVLRGRDGLGVWSRFMGKIRINATIVSMGFKATTLMSQFAGFTNSMEHVSNLLLAKNIAKLTASPRQTTDYVFAKSAEMKHRIQNRDRDIKDALRGLTGRTDPLAHIQEFAFLGIGYADLYVAIPTWMAKYEEMIAAGKSEKVSIAAADRAVRLSQGAGGMKDLPAVMRGQNDLMKLSTMFYSYFSVLYSRLRDMGKKMGNEDTYRRTIARSFYIIFLPAIMGELLANRGPDDWDDEEEVAKWLAKTIAIYPTATVPILRDVANASMSKIEGKGFFGYKMSPAAGAMSKIAELPPSVVSGIAGEKDWDAVAFDAFEASGYMFGLPTGQAKITGGYVYDIINGDEVPEDMGEFIQNMAYRRTD